MSEPDALIDLLAVPGVHSGTELGKKLGISRVAIKKRIDRLASIGFPVETVSGRGYKLKENVELLSKAHIVKAIQFENQNQHLNLQVFQHLDSTNTQLSSMSSQLGQVNVVLTESQSMGQGRRGRSWVSSPYKNLMLSVGYTYDAWPDNPSAISLAFSVAVHRALMALGANSIKLKWPNDLVSQEAKLGGLLVSAAGEADGDLALVLGVGINMDVEENLLADIDQPAIDLAIIGHSRISRNALAAEIISNTADMLSLYPQTGFKPFADYWNEHATFVGEQVRLFDNEQEFTGVLKGVDEFGELCLLDQQGRLSKFNRSELSLRAL